MISWRFHPTTFRRFPKIFLWKLSKGHTKVSKFSEDCRGLLLTFVEDPKMFWSHISRYNNNLRVKHYISEAINIFTIEVVENTPPESSTRCGFLWILRVVYFWVKHSCLYKNHYNIKLTAFYCGKSGWNNNNQFFDPSLIYFFCFTYRFFTLRGQQVCLCSSYAF